ncbi:PAS sensor signal transduction histidine kinase [Candidatus Koribacter versatilis Ellin345]|uniref:PAS sensor signal transduction histidine kinase n=1 Tax=Koribacter versatilis (strain Ellin345) TaxID=204669 RepID=Q1IM12_KORVE|nr:PAS sensor signal transduction histidine kinase [Candidatus Koribacter versatilis Ellin345]
MQRSHFNPAWLKLTGRTLAESIGEGWIACVHPDDLLPLRAARTNESEGHAAEYRLRDASGNYRWMRDMATPVTIGDHHGLLGYCIDIEGQKQAEHARRELAERLVTAQEAERARIARELHDDISQSLMILTFQMERAGKPVSNEPGKRHPDAPALADDLREVVRRISKMAHELHSSSLEYLGLSRAIQGACREFSKQWKIPVDCELVDLPQKLDNMTSLCLLRITQEALHNIAKHSRATNVTVQLSSTEDQLKLVIRDNGIGFDVEQAKLAGGIGLLSMRERTNLVHGTLALVSVPGQGATVECSVPFNHDH